MRRLRHGLGSNRNELARPLHVLRLLHVLRSLHVLRTLHILGAFHVLDLPSLLGSCTHALGRSARRDVIVFIIISGQVKNDMRSLYRLIERLTGARGSSSSSSSRWACHSAGRCGGYGYRRDGCRCRWRWLSCQQLLLLLWLGWPCDSWLRVESPSIGAFASCLVRLGGLVEKLAESKKNSMMGWSAKQTSTEM